MKSRLILWLFALLLTANAALAAFPSPPGSYTHTAVATGSWNDPAVWGGSVPGNGAIVLIPSGLRVSVTSLESSRIKLIRVEGEMRMWIHSSTRLYTETLYVAPTGLFMIGAVNNPVKPSFTAELIFTSSGAFDLSWDPKQLSRGFISDGVVRMYGKTKTPFIEMANDAFQGDSVIDVNNTIPLDWEERDAVVLTGTHFRRNTGSQEEERKIAGISGQNLTLDAALSHDHVRADGLNTPLHIANLTRNIILRSDTTTLTRDRGHVMFRNSDVDVRYVAFVDVGRTDKTIPLDDLTVTTVTTVTPNTYNLTVPADSAISNRRGRYSVHFHQNGTQPSLTDPPSKVYGSVVEGSPGWGFVNHSSHVDFQDNVAYDFDGAGFVTEAGDELGNFFRNIAIGGRGNGQYKPVRIVFQNPDRPQPLSDFGFGGQGFWFQGPAIRVKDNVANSCNAAGMIWFTTGAPDPEQLFTENVGGQNFTHNRYHHFPRSALSGVYGSYPGFASLAPRHWEHSVTDEKLVISDLPILELDGFTSYANLVGFRLRFNNHDNVAWYNDPPFDFDSQIAPGAGVRIRQDVPNLTLWNNEQGFRSRYAQKTDWSNIEVDNRLSYSNTTAYSGGEINFQNQNSTLDGVDISGYAVAFWVANGNFNVYNQLTLTNQTYDNYASANFWNTSKSCTKPSSLSVTNITTTSAKINWAFDSTHERYLVRYKITTDQAWSYVDTTATSVTVFGLAPGTTYTYQVIAGCDIPDADPTTPDKTVTVWTNAATFTTN